MLSTIERVLILKAVSFFVDTSEEVLIEIAAVLEEADVQPDTKIFSEGDPGHTLYIIVDGQIRIHNQQQTLAILSENEVFGEMSILDPAPRSATATAITETRLLSLDQEMFNEITADHHDVAQGVMRLLARRLRQTQTQPKDTQIQL